MDEVDTALAKAKLAQENEGTMIRIGSSFLNPSKVLTDFWEPLRKKYPRYRFGIIPYDDASEQILSWVASIGEKFDVMIGAFNSNQMMKYCNYLELGFYELCVAVPHGHYLENKERLTIQDLHGEHLMMVTPGDTPALQTFRDMLQMTHPQIVMEDVGYYYDMDTFNRCQQDGCLLLTLDAWIGLHPSLITLPVEWSFKVPYGILYAKEPSEAVASFVAILRNEIVALQKSYG